MCIAYPTICSVFSSLEGTSVICIFWHYRLCRSLALTPPIGAIVRNAQPQSKGHLGHLGPKLSSTLVFANCNGINHTCCVCARVCACVCNYLRVHVFL